MNSEMESATTAEGGDKTVKQLQETHIEVKIRELNPQELVDVCRRSLAIGTKIPPKLKFWKPGDVDEVCKHIYISGE